MPANADYRAAAGAATALLLHQRLYALDFDVTRLQHEVHAVVFDTMQHYCSVTRATMGELSKSRDTRDGLTLHRSRGGKRMSIVLYNESMRNPRRLRFTLAHELGHIYLEHQSDGLREEREANAFAAQLLLPRILVEQYIRDRGGRQNAAELCRVFGVSLGAAENRMKSLRFSPRYTADDWELLRRFGRLLPPADSEGPLITC